MKSLIETIEKQLLRDAQEKAREATKAIQAAVNDLRLPEHAKTKGDARFDTLRNGFFEAMNDILAERYFDAKVDLVKQSIVGVSKKQSLSNVRLAEDIKRIHEKLSNKMGDS